MSLENRIKTEGSSIQASRTPNALQNMWTTIGEFAPAVLKDGISTLQYAATNLDTGNRETNPLRIAGNLLHSVLLIEGKDYRFGNHVEFTREGNKREIIGISNDGKRFFGEGGNFYPEDQYRGSYETERSRKRERKPLQEKVEDFLLRPANAIANIGSLDPTYTEGMFTIHPDKNTVLITWEDENGRRLQLNLTKKDFNKANNDRFGLQEGLTKLGVKFK